MGGQVAHQSHGGGGAEAAPVGTTHLGGHADRVALLGADQDGLDVLAIVETEEKLAGVAARRGQLLAHGQPRQRGSRPPTGIAIPWGYW